MEQKRFGPSLAWVGLLGASFAGLGSVPAFESPTATASNRHPSDRDHKADHQAKEGRPTIPTRQLSNSCTSAVQAKAEQQFQTHALVFRNSGVHDTMWGNQKRVEGMFEIRDGVHQGESYRFSCAVQKHGAVRSVSLGPAVRDPRIIVDPW